jgi:hypothetical protein
MKILSEQEIEQSQKVAQIETDFATNKKLIVVGELVALAGMISTFGGSPDDPSIHMSPLSIMLMAGGAVLGIGAYVANKIRGPEQKNESDKLNELQSGFYRNVQKPTR